MKRFFSLCCTLTLPFLLTGFFGLDPTWESINATIDRQYPTVKNITVDELKAALDQGRSPVLIDVREDDEFAISHLPNAIKVKKAQEITYPKDTPMVIYCSVGVRSAALAKELLDKGFTEVKNLRGSIFAWANAGYPLRRGTSAVRTVHPYNKKWGKLLNTELHQYRVDPSEAEKAR
ncbi:MAG: rhodanese-like domain-containing protein [Pseudomonadota bacterium]